MEGKVQNVILKSKEIIRWIDSKIENIQFNSTPRERISCSCFSIALEHHRSIVLLISNDLTGSACTLIRPIYESFIRGVWFQHKASDKEVGELIKKDIVNKRLDKLVEEIETVPDYDVGVLSVTRKEARNLMNSYVHCGFLQIMRRNTADFIEPNYSDEEKVEALNFANAFGLLSFLEMAKLANNCEIQEKIYAKIDEFAEYSNPPKP